MADGFLKGDAIKTKLQSRLGIDAFAADTPWDTIIADANAAAGNTIKGALLGRGYSPDQIRSWDRLQEFQTDIALFWALVNGGVTKDYDDRLITKLDRRAELATVDVTINGALVQPGGGAGVGGGIRSGTLKNDSDLFPAVRRCVGGLAGWWR